MYFKVEDVEAILKFSVIVVSVPSFTVICCYRNVGCLPIPNYFCGESAECFFSSDVIKTVMHKMCNLI